MVLAERARRAAATLAEAEYVRLVALATGDGIAATGLMALALLREGVDFHIQFRAIGEDAFSEDLTQDRVEKTLFLGLGSGELDAIGSLGSSAIILDPATPVDRVAGESLVVGAIEDREGGADEATASALAYLVAKDMHGANADLYPLALAGAYAEGHVSAGGARGLDGELLSGAIEKKRVETAPPFVVEGPTLLDALSQSVDPYFPGLSGRARAVKRFLDTGGPEAGLDPASLAEGPTRLLASRLTLNALGATAGSAGADALLAPRYMSARPFLGTSDINAVARQCLAASARERPGTALAALISGSPMEGDVSRFPAELLPLLMKAESESAAAYVALDAPTPGASAACALLASRYALKPEAIVLSSAPSRARLVVDARSANPRQPLALAAHAAAEAVGGVAWGTRRFARARIPADSRDAYLDAFKASARRGRAS